MPVTIIVDNYTYTFNGKQHWFISELTAKYAAELDAKAWNVYQDSDGTPLPVPEVTRVTKTYVFGDE